LVDRDQDDQPRALRRRDRVRCRKEERGDGEQDDSDGESAERRAVHESPRKRAWWAAR
jgi:hypothetical protein